MYRKLPRSTDNIIGCEIDWPLDPDEIEALTGDLQGALAAQGSPRLLIDLRGLPDPETFWSDPAMAPLLESLDRVVLIGEPEWAGAPTRGQCRGECRCYDRRQVDEAWAWIGEAEPFPRHRSRGGVSAPAGG